MFDLSLSFPELVKTIASPAGVALVTIGLTQLAKSFIPEKLYALVPLVIATGLSLLVFGLSVGSALVGIVIGLVAVGIYAQKQVAK